MTFMGVILFRILFENAETEKKKKEEKKQEVYTC